MKDDSPGKGKETDLDVHEDGELDFVKEDFLEEKLPRPLVAQNGVRQQKVKMLIPKFVVRRRKPESKEKGSSRGLPGAAIS